MRFQALVSSTRKYNKTTYHRLYSISDQFVYQIIVIVNASLIHHVVVTSW
jgi:hypothetical protein